MPTSPVTTKSFVSTYVRSAEPKKNFSTWSRIGMRTSSSAMIGYIFTALPAPLKAKYTSSTLDLFAAGAIPAGRTIVIQRITTKWSAAAVKWENRPTATTTNQATFTTVSTIPLGAKVSFDVTNLLQDASNGQPWYGFQISITGESGADRAFYSQRGPAGKTPVLTTMWSDAPLAPTALSPSEGRAVSLAKPVLECNHIDVSGNTDLVAMEVQIDDAADFATPVWVSGEVATTSPQIDLATTSYPGISAGQTRYWRVRLKDGAGLWSAWSGAASFTFVAKGTLAISSPTGPAIEDPTQTVIWTLTGATQRARQVFVKDHITGKTLFDSGKITTTELDWSIPGIGMVSPVINKINAPYTISVRVWDTIDRAATVGDTPYLEKSVTVVYNVGAAAPFVGTSVTKDSAGRPWATISGTRSAAPDYILLLRDGDVVGKYPGIDCLVSGTTYAVIDRAAEPRKQHTWNLLALSEGGVASSLGPDATDTLKPPTAWLCSEDGEYSIPLTNYTNGLSLAEESSTFNVLGSTENVKIYASLRGWEGSFSGVMTRGVGDRSADQYRQELLAIRDAEGMPVILSWADHSIRAVVSDITYAPAVYVEEIVYAASFNVSERNRPTL